MSLRERGRRCERASFMDPQTGRKLIQSIHPREELFKGTHADPRPTS
jgi:hypothetical protein